MQGWPSHSQVPMPEQSGPPLSVGRVGTQSGTAAISLGLLVVFIGGVLVLLSIRNPSFDPTQATRAPADEGSASVEVAQPGDYVVYLETPDCSSSSVQLVQTGQTETRSGPPPGGWAQAYDFDSRCGVVDGVYGLPTSGEWTAMTPMVAGAYVALYPSGDPPTRVDAAPIWIGGVLLILGGALFARGMVQHRRWQRAIRALG
jgi:hypothetical protein